MYDSANAPEEVTYSRTFAGLNQAINFYVSIDRGSQNPHVSRQQLDLKLQLNGINNNTQAQLVALINALIDTNFDQTIPTAAPSKLTPSGNIRNLYIFYGITSRLDLAGVRP